MAEKTYKLRQSISWNGSNIPKGEITEILYKDIVKRGFGKLVYESTASKGKKATD